MLKMMDSTTRHAGSRKACISRSGALNCLGLKLLVCMTVIVMKVRSQDRAEDKLCAHAPYVYHEAGKWHLSIPSKWHQTS